MASDVDICNLALAKLGQNPIVGITDPTPQARILNRMYPMLRDKLQRVYRWNFTRVYSSLAALSTAPPFEYSFAYPLPVDCLRLELMSLSFNNQFGVGMPGVNLSDYNNSRLQDYRIVGRQIWTNVGPPVYIQFASRITDPTLFDVAFNEAFACYLAWQLCEQVTGSGQKKDALAKEFQFSMQQARTANAIELAPEAIPDDTLILGRLQS